MLQDKTCPECGGTDFGKGRLTGYAKLMPVDKVLSMGSAIIAEVCTNCGNIICLKVERPDKFKPD
ncbi:MAG TPA: transcription initiation factor TFIIIB [Verrucomicrobiae bacterium]|nr:transcription initiation factor TFIIIB [Verrucomicrobiae bacterium]